MAEPVFFPASKPLTLAEIADLTGAPALPAAYADKPIVGVAALAVAGPDELTFFDNRNYVGALQSTRAGACLCGARDVGE